MAAIRVTRANHLVRRSSAIATQTPLLEQPPDRAPRPEARWARSRPHELSAFWPAGDVLALRLNVVADLGDVVDPDPE
jgi:hypothetical protein